MTIYDAAMRYAADGVPLVVLAGKEYGSGSSRDWAAKGTALLGVRAVIAESFERIHRSNLIGMGVLPLQFPAGQSAESLGLTGQETFTVRGLADVSEQTGTLPVRAGDGRVRRGRAHRHPGGGGLLPPRRHPAVRAAIAALPVSAVADGATDPAAPPTPRPCSPWPGTPPGRRGSCCWPAGKAPCRRWRPRARRPTWSPRWITRPRSSSGPACWTPGRTTGCSARKAATSPAPAACAGWSTRSTGRSTTCTATRPGRSRSPRRSSTRAAARRLSGEAVAGVVLVPATGVTWTATAGRRRLARRAPAARLAGDVAGAGAGRHRLRVRRRDPAPPGGGADRACCPPVRDIRRSGSAAFDLCCAAEGLLDAYYERGLNPWDLAAGGAHRPGGGTSGRRTRRPARVARARRRRSAGAVSGAGGPAGHGPAGGSIVCGSPLRRRGRITFGGRPP